MDTTDDQRSPMGFHGEVSSTRLRLARIRPCQRTAQGGGPRVWVDEPPGSHVIGTAICLSCLLEAGRYGDLIELLACARMKWWHWHHFGAEALARQGAWDAAIAYADGCRAPQGYDDGRQIDRFCEEVLIKWGRADDAYLRYGLKTATGPTYLAVFRKTVDHYPDRDRRQVLLDLIETRGERANGSLRRRMPGSSTSPSYARGTTQPRPQPSCALRETLLPRPEIRGGGRVGRFGTLAERRWLRP
jgi:hypothetical protein